MDQAAERVILAYQARPVVIDTLRAGDQHDDRELSAVRDQLALADPTRTTRRRTLSVVLAARSEPVMLAEIATLETREKDLATSTCSAA